MALPEKLTFFAVPGIFAPIPKLHGHVAQYVGRRLDYDAIKANTRVRVGDFHAVLDNQEACYPIDNSMNSEFNRSHGIHVLGELAKMAKHGDIVPGDAVTAKWSGVKFNPPVAPATPVAQPVQQPVAEQLSTPVVDEQPKAAPKLSKPKREAT